LIAKPYKNRDGRTNQYEWRERGIIINYSRADYGLVLSQIPT